MYGESHGNNNLVYDIAFLLSHLPKSPLQISDNFSGGFSPNMWNIILFNCDFSLSCPFFFFQHPARTVQQIFTLYGSNDVDQPKDGPFGVPMMIDITWGEMCPKNSNVPPKTHPKGALIGIFKPNCQNLKIAIYPKPCTRSVQFWWRNSYCQQHVVRGPPLLYMKYNMADVRHLRNWHNVIARTPVVRFT